MLHVSHECHQHHHKSLTNFYLFIADLDPPTVSVHLANEDPSRNITRAEGQNVTLKCRADARPPVTSFGWYKNVSASSLFIIIPCVFFLLSFSYSGQRNHHLKNCSRMRSLSWEFFNRVCFLSFMAHLRFFLDCTSDGN